MGREAFLIGRALGYFFVTVLWFAIWLVTLALLAALPLALPTPLSEASVFRGGFWQTLGIVVALAVIVPAAFAFVFLIVILTASQTLLSALAFSRSLRAGYANEKVTGTLQSKDTIGLSITSVALSLLPRRPTAYSTAITHLNFRSWLPNGAWFVGLWALSYIYFGVLFVALWPIRNPAAIIGIAVVGVALAAFAALRLRAGWLRLGVDVSSPIPRPVDRSPRPEATQARTTSGAGVDTSAEGRERRRQNYLAFKASQDKK
jgi:hypothetical protein